MKLLILTAMITVLSLFAAAAMAAVQSSNNYTINGGSIMMGGGATPYMLKTSISGIGIGQGVFIPPGGVSSRSYIIRPAVPSSPREKIHNGDINGDGRVDIVDALLALKTGAGLVALSEEELFRGDVGPMVNNMPAGNGRIDLEDALLILHKAVGMGW